MAETQFEYFRRYMSKPQNRFTVSGFLGAQIAWGRKSRDPGSEIFSRDDLLGMHDMLRAYEMSGGWAPEHPEAAYLFHGRIINACLLALKDAHAAPENRERIISAVTNAIADFCNRETPEVNYGLERLQERPVYLQIHDAFPQIPFDDLPPTGQKMMQELGLAGDHKTTRASEPIRRHAARRFKEVLKNNLSIGANIADSYEREHDGVIALFQKISRNGETGENTLANTQSAAAYIIAQLLVVDEKDPDTGEYIKDPGTQDRIRITTELQLENFLQELMDRKKVLSDKEKAFKESLLPVSSITRDTTMQRPLSELARGILTQLGLENSPKGISKSDLRKMAGKAFEPVVMARVEDGAPLAKPNRSILDKIRRLSTEERGESYERTRNAIVRVVQAMEEAYTASSLNNERQRILNAAVADINKGEVPER